MDVNKRKKKQIRDKNESKLVYLNNNDIIYHHKVLRITTLLMICEGNKIRSSLAFPNALSRGLVTVTLLVTLVLYQLNQFVGHGSQAFSI